MTILHFVFAKWYSAVLLGRVLEPGLYPISAWYPNPYICLPSSPSFVTFSTGDWKDLDFPRAFQFLMVPSQHPESTLRTSACPFTPLFQQLALACVNTALKQQRDFGFPLSCSNVRQQNRQRAHYLLGVFNSGAAHPCNIWSIF